MFRRTTAIGTWANWASKPLRLTETPVSEIRTHIRGNRSYGEYARAAFARLRVLLATSALLVSLSVTPGSALAVGPDAVMYPTGWDANAIARADDTFNQVWDCPSR